MRQAIILTAGEGRRLRPFTVTKPKVMLSIAGKPMIQYVLEALAKNGIRNIVLVVGYRREQIFDYIGSGERFGVEVTYITQDRQLGTAHALLQAKGVADSQFLVVPGDKLIEADTLSQIAATRPPALLAKIVKSPVTHGVVTIEKGMVTKIAEKPGELESNIINTGIYAFDTTIFDCLENELDIPNALTRMMAEGTSITAVETTGTWLNVVYPWDILSLNNAILKKIPASHNGTIESGVSLTGQVTVGKGTVIRTNSYIVGPVVIGEGCEIGPSVCILPSTSVGDNVVISPFTEVSNSVIGTDVHIGSGSCVQDSVIDRGCIIGSHFSACSSEAEVKVDGEYHVAKVGAMLGDGCRFDNCVTCQPGVLVGNYSQVKSLKLIGGRIPDRSMVV